MTNGNAVLAENHPITCERTVSEPTVSRPNASREPTDATESRPNASREPTDALTQPAADKNDLNTFRLALLKIHELQEENSQMREEIEQSRIRENALMKKCDLLAMHLGILLGNEPTPNDLVFQILSAAKNSKNFINRS